MSISVLVEFFYRGDYMSPLEVYDLECFINDFVTGIYSQKNIERFFNKYDHKSKNQLQKLIGKKNKFFLSTIRKKDKIYEISIINEKKLFEYYFVRFLVRDAIHKLQVINIKGEFKIIRFI